MKELREKVEAAFKQLKFSIIYFNEVNNANGVDCWVQRSLDRQPLSVEIKKATYDSSGGSMRTEPVMKNRLKDDLIAIVINDYVLIEPMEQHLKNCNKSGWRMLTILK